MSAPLIGLIDAGNSRLKWRLERASTVIDEGSFTYRDDPDWQRQLALPEGIDFFLIGSVAGDATNTELKKWLALQSRAEINFVEVARECLGLRVAYADTTRLGVDRYLAMLGARHRDAGAVCVADVGTAMTLDAVDAQGVHFGGLITPGPRTMIDSLLHGTAGIGDASEASPDTPFARDTSDAVTGGAVYACAALIDRFAADFAQRTDSPVKLFLTGGGAARIAPRLRTMAVDAPDLVFTGLRALGQAIVDSHTR